MIMGSCVRGPCPTSGFLAMIVTTLSGAILLIGYIMVGFTQRKQGLHDMMAGTLVYKTRDPSSVRSSASVFE